MLVPLCVWCLGVAALADVTGSASDAVTLHDGSIVRGQVTPGGKSGGWTLLVRRDWARLHAPAWLERCERQEVPLLIAGRRERKERLTVWRRERAGTSGRGDDRVVAWIDREVSRLSTLQAPRTVLTAATLNRSEVRSITRQPAETGRLLRLGWLTGVNNVETLPVQELTTALRSRGRVRADDPARVDVLLPIYPEPDDRWRVRRAATEVTVEPGLRFVRYRQFTLPETEPAGDTTPRTTSELLDSPAGRTALQSIQAVTPFDAVRELLDAAAERGRTGVIVSRLEFQTDSDRVESESAFWVCQSGGRWNNVFSRKAVVMVNEPDEDPAPALDDTPIRSALLVLETVASAPSSPVTSQRRHVIGTTAGRALGRSRVALDLDLAPFLLPAIAETR